MVTAPNPIANLSQEYIDHLKKKKEEAERRFNLTLVHRTAAQNALVDAQNWENKLKAYWVRIKESDKIANSIFNHIDDLLKQAGKVVSNVECTVEALELLLCNVRAVSKALEVLSDDYHTLKQAIDRACMHNQGLPPNGAIMTTLKKFNEKLTAGTLACSVALAKVLNLVKQAYLLRRAIASKRVESPLDANDCEHELEGLLDKEGHMYPMEIDEEVEIKLAEYTIKEPGLEWHLHKLERLLHKGPPQLSPDADGYPCDDRLGFIPVFPLSKEEYYSQTRDQYRKAQDKSDDINKYLTQIESRKQLAQANFEAYKAAYDAAVAAKNGKK